MRFARSLLIFSYGLFTIGAQTLLFREFVTAFEGNDISVGVFFGTWFLWIGLGALLVRRWSRLADLLLDHVESLFLLYVPAFLAQFLLILQVRTLAGIASYDLMSIQTLVFWAMVVNAPVSLLTGLLFPLACRWIEETGSFPISRVYILEAVGSFTGGLAVTALLAYHVQVPRVFLLLALVLLLSVGLAGLCRVGRAHLFPRMGVYAALILAAISTVAIATGADGILAGHLRAMKWSKLLPRETFEGAFTTAQAGYLYGRYRGQWVVMREGGVCEALPNEDEAGQTAATTLCQNPQARRALVVGSGLAVCRRLLLLPQMEEVVWTNPDSEYVDWLPRHVPGDFGIGDRRFRPVAEEIRQYLGATKDRFDLVIVNLPDVASAAFNRYFTLEFYEKVKGSLRDGGILSLSIAGNENIMGAELVGLGASAQQTLEQVFSHLVLVPGDQTWLIASDSANLTGDPALLRDRFAAMAGSQRVFPPTGLLSVYLPDRAAQALAAYAKADLPQELLINRDSRPLTHLYGLLLAARQSGASVTRFVKLLAVSGWLPFIVPVLVFVVLRLWASPGQASGRPSAGFDSSFLVFSTGWVGIATIIILMYAYETHFGSLYLHVGVISSLFMAGLTAGALVCSVLVRAYPETPDGVVADRWHALLVPILLAHGLVLAAIAFGLPGTDVGGSLGHGVFATAFVLSGLCCGGYWPMAAARLADGGFEADQAGSRLETADHLGACLGGLATSLLMVPILGTRLSLLVLIGLLAANVPAASLTLGKREAAARTAGIPVLRHAGYALFGVVASIVVCSNLLAHAGASLQPSLPDFAVRALAGERQTQQVSAVLKNSGKRATYFTLADAEQKPAGYLLSSADFAPEIRGFGGRLNLAIHVDASGKLVDFLLVRSNETPSYLDLLQGWRDSLKGKTLYTTNAFSDVHAVTGATITSEAILRVLQTSGRRFAEQVLGGQPGAPAESLSAYRPDTVSLYLIGAFAAAFLVMHRGGFRSRIVVLALTFIFGGLVLNAQYSSEQAVSLLSLNTPAARLTGVFLLAIGVPLAVLLFGNLYCGYVCPFGAAQELLGYVLPRRWRPTPQREEMQWARCIKYLVLAVLLVVFFVSRDRRTLAGDPLTSAFALRSALPTWPVWMFGVVAAALIGSFFYVRFWCRYLCPVGAFLSLLNHLRLLRRWVPAKWFGRCEFGLTAGDHLDCLYCDRCRHPRTPEAAATPNPPRPRPLVLAVAACGLLVASVSVSQFRRVMPALLQEPVPAATAGQPRDIDVRQIQTLIEQHQLSDHKAEYYKLTGESSR
jgi:predicted membrane-bound spermidine synthase